MSEDALGFHKIFIRGYCDAVTFFIHVAKVEMFYVRKGSAYLLP